MKKKCEFALVSASVGGVFGFLISEKAYSLRTTDWAARGVPLLERLWDTMVVHGLPGGIVGLVVGFLFGMVIPQSLVSKLCVEPLKRTLNEEAKVILYIVMFLVVAVYFHFFEPTLLTVAINFLILFAIYTVAEYLFGKPEDKT